MSDTRTTLLAAMASGEELKTQMGQILWALQEGNMDPALLKLLVTQFGLSEPPEEQVELGCISADASAVDRYGQEISAAITEVAATIAKDNPPATVVAAHLQQLLCEEENPEKRVIILTLFLDQDMSIVPYAQIKVPENLEALMSEPINREAVEAVLPRIRRQVMWVLGQEWTNSVKLRVLHQMIVREDSSAEQLAFLHALTFEACSFRGEIVVENVIPVIGMENVFGGGVGDPFDQGGRLPS